jgi:adenylate kinase
MVAARTQADPLNVVLLGPPGAGKGTQAGPLCEALGLSYLATGDLLRGHRERRTPLGREVARFMVEGQLVPDQLVITMILEQLEDDRHGFLLDGFPRTLAQAEALSDAVDTTAALLVDAPDDTIVERIAGRRRCPDGHVYHVIFDPPAQEGICDRDGQPLARREDDAPETVRERLRVYHELTEPVAGYYEQRGRLLCADGTRHQAEVQRELLTSLRRFAGTRTWRA